MALILTVTASVLTLPAASQETFSVKPEVPVTAVDERIQLGNNSPTLAGDPTDPRFIVLANRLDNPDFGCALSVSGDGGRGWLPVNPVPKLPKGADKCYAPEVAFDAQGVLYYLFIALHGQGNSPSGTYLVTSRDRGRSFTRPRQVLGPERYQVRMAIDRSLGTKGRLHLVWLQAGSDPPLGGLAPPPNPIMTAYSDDGGDRFSKPVPVGDSSRRILAPSLALGRDHRLHISFHDLEDDVRDYQGLPGPTWEGNWSIYVASSSDGGRTFASPVKVDGDLVPPERVMLIYTMTPSSIAADAKGSVFLSWYDGRNEDWDVFLSRTGNGGKSWGDLKRLNDDPVGNGRHQYMPRLSVASNGRLDAIFFDRRNDPQNQRNDVYFTSSSDSGESFAPNLKLTQEPSDSQIGTRYPIPSALNLVEFGSRVGLLAQPSSSIAAWTDTRNGDVDDFQQDIFATEVDLPGADAPLARSRDRGASRVPIVAVGAGLALVTLAGAAGLLVRRRARRSPAP